jgi:hypothetical protein
MWGWLAVQVPCTFEQVRAGVPHGVIEMRAVSCGDVVLGVGIARSKRRAKLMASVRGLQYFNENADALVAFAEQWRVRQLVQQEERQKMEVEEGRQEPQGSTATAEPPAAVSPPRKRERET